MEFGIAIETDEGGARRVPLVQSVGDSIRLHLRDKEFGAGVERVTVGLIIERVVPGFESFAREPRAPSFEATQTVGLVGGGSEELRNAVGWDVKLEPEQYERFVSASDREARALLVSALTDSLEELDQLRAEIEDFDFEQFKSVVTAHLREISSREG